MRAPPVKPFNIRIGFALWFRPPVSGKCGCVMLRFTRDYAAQARTASAVNIMLGLWLIVSPWVFDYRGRSAALSSIAVGALIAILASIRRASLHDSAGLSGINLLLAFWTAAAPWIYEYASNTRALCNDVFVGMLVAVFAVCSAIATDADRRRRRRASYSGTRGSGVA
jgi:hypothetical protein